jgi:hypothetical protein
MNSVDETRQWTAAAWLKGSRSYGGGECVEVAAISGGVAVRDSKDPDGPKLWFTREEWAVFMAGVRTGEFDHLC